MATDSQTPETPGEKPRGTIGFASVLVPVAVILAGVLFALSYLRGREGDHAHAPEGAITRKVGEALPDLELRTLDGKTKKLSELGAKVVVLNFWATWCGPCVKELPSLQKLATEYGPRGLAVIGVNVDEDPEKVLAPFLAKHGITFPNYVDAKGELAERFGISGLPLTVVVDGNRKLLLEQLGDEEWFSSAFRKQFELWLNGSNPG